MHKHYLVFIYKVSRVWFRKFADKACVAQKVSPDPSG
jgi:hypothetical protein